MATSFVAASRPNRASWLSIFLLVVFCLTGRLSGQAKLKLDGETQAPVDVSACATQGMLFIRVDLKDQWHLYAPGSTAGVPITVKALENSDYELSGEITVPQNDRGEISGTAVVRVPIRRKRSGNRLSVEFGYQACDARTCLLPARCSLLGEPSRGPVDVLLMVRAQGDRADRIAGMFRSEGFRCTVRTFESRPDRGFCDRFDVVIGDCEGYQQSKSIVSFARDFPKTQTPIIAVGFLGSELVEAHQIAMTSGYI